MEARKSYPQFGLASWEIIKTPQKELMAVKYYHPDRNLLTIHNFSSQARELYWMILAKLRFTKIY